MSNAQDRKTSIKKFISNENQTGITYARVVQAKGQAERAQGGCLGTKGRRKT